METEKQYYIVSIKHTSKGDTALTFWGHNERGYTWDRSRAGIYNESDLPHIVNELNVAVEKEKIDAQWKEANDFNDRYVSVPNVERVHKELGISSKEMKAKKFASCRMRFDIHVSPATT